MTARGGYDPNKHFVRDIEDLHRRLARLHEHAAVAWDRDGVNVLDEILTVFDPVASSMTGHHGILGYAVDRGRRIFRLVLDGTDDLGVRWVEYDRRASRPEQDERRPFQGLSCPHCLAGEPSVYDDVLFHYAHPAGDKLKMCHSPWRERCRRCSASISSQDAPCTSSTCDPSYRCTCLRHDQGFGTERHTYACARRHAETRGRSAAHEG